MELTKSRAGANRIISRRNQQTTGDKFRNGEELESMVSAGPPVRSNDLHATIFLFLQLWINVLARICHMYIANIPLAILSIRIYIDEYLFRNFIYVPIHWKNK